VLTAGVVGNVRSATNLMMVRLIERVIARGAGIGGREISGRIIRLAVPVMNEDDLQVGPQHIIFVDKIDRTCLRILRRAGGLIVREPGMDSPGAVAAVEMGLPAIIGVEGHLDQLLDGVAVILDANNGQVIEWKK
jgi:pyruvate kinase